MADLHAAGGRRARRRRRSRRHGHAVIGAALLCGLVLVLAAAATALLLTADPRALVSSCGPAAAHPRHLSADSFLYAADGSRLGAVSTARNREPVALERISHWMPTATVAIEDHRFWRHGALDPEGIVRAAIADLRAGRAVQGGSTLTQQLVRARYLSSGSMTVVRKLTEACLAIKLADRWSKRRILQEYLNTVFYGHRAYGVQAAAETYFARPASRLRLTQAALLSGLPQAPSDYDPLRFPKAARARRNVVLRALRSAGAISPASLRRALARPLGLHPGHRYLSLEAPAFFDMFLRGLRRSYGPTVVRRGGLRVQTTLDPRLQRMADRALGAWLSADGDPAGALVAIDPRNGAIRALATLVPGGRRLRFNLATQARRQAGSAFKTFTLTAAIEQGIPLSSIWNGPPSLTIPDRRCMDGTTPWTVHNFADEAAGTMTLLDAIAHSVNTIFVQVALRAGLHNIVGVAHRLGIRSPLTPVCSITLGPEGVSPLEMTDAFATLAAGGVHHDPQGVRRVTTTDGRVLGRWHTAGGRVISAQTAQTVAYALSGVIKGGTGIAADPGRPAAGKTGTAENESDAWFCGFVPQLASCVWIGYPAAEIPMTSLDGFSP
ncbi:MAG: penicillin-binding protein, partial [Pseudonocardiales bacterium]|nr:penicillin-binding protein [Pseudonocardiales bacterium]